MADRGWRVRPQVRAGDYRIDLVVEGAEDRRLAIELDGDKYHGPERWAEDYSRQLALERMGWRFWRCWGSCWTLDPEGCLADLEATLKSLGITPLGSDARLAIYTEHRIVGRAKAGEPQEELTEAVDEPIDFALEREGPPRPSVEPRLGTVARFTPKAAKVATRAESEPVGDFLLEEDRFVEVGDRVIVMYSDDPGNPKTLVLTQEQDDDPKMGVIFVGRPLGKALVGQAEEEVIKLPAGDDVREATILRIEKAAFAA